MLSISAATASGRLGGRKAAGAGRAVPKRAASQRRLAGSFGLRDMAILLARVAMSGEATSSSELEVKRK
jgi:hypothetical protein